MSGVKFSLDLIDRASGPAKRVSGSLDKVMDVLNKLKRLGAKTDPLAKMNASMSKLDGAVGKGGMLSSLGGVASFAGGPATAVIGVLTSIASKVALVGVGFTALSGAAAAFFAKAALSAAAFRESSISALDRVLGGGGAAAFEKATKLAGRYGLALEDTVNQLRGLRTIGFDDSTSTELIKRIADLKAVNPEANLGGAMLAIRQIQSTGKLQGDELMQLSEAGLAAGKVYESLGKIMGKSRDEVLKLQQAGKIDSTTAVRGILDAIGAQTKSSRAGDAALDRLKTFSGAMEALRNLPGQLLQKVAKAVDMGPLAGVVNDLRKALSGDGLDRVLKTAGVGINSLVGGAKALWKALAPVAGDVFESIFTTDNMKGAERLLKGIGKTIETYAPALTAFGSGWKAAFDSKVVDGAAKGLAKFVQPLDALSTDEKAAGLKALTKVMELLGFAFGVAAVGIGKAGAQLGNVIAYLEKLAALVDMAFTKLEKLGAYSPAARPRVEEGRPAGNDTTMSFNGASIADAIRQGLTAIGKAKDPPAPVDNRSFTINAASSRTNSELASLIMAQLQKLSPVGT